MTNTCPESGPIEKQLLLLYMDIIAHLHQSFIGLIFVDVGEMPDTN
jgi:hypothetical protein